VTIDLLKPIWNGAGDADDAIWFTKEKGEIVGRPYLRDRASKHIGRWRRSFPLAARKTTIASTIDNDDWLRIRAYQTAASVCRDVEDHLLSN
jgi:hypothetical protein